MFRIKYCREIAFKLLYETDVIPQPEEFAAEPPEQILEKYLDFFRGLNNKEKEFILTILQKVRENKKSIDQLIADNLIGWKLERLMPVDRNLLRMGIAESYINKEKAIIIDDVVRIAKKYGGEESYRIINAVLDKVLK
ncbi:MAG: transcription antitermination factor NusB [Acidobacteria bacterium]|jgi:N utilization substance protein B|nr:transcription antitermination factor NusB [Acidobacteriota bacterium]